LHGQCYNFTVKVSELGEFGLIDLIQKKIAASRSSRNPNLIIGAGDDAAAWQGDGTVQLATTDSLVDGVHFSRDITSWYELGWKALAISLSDIAAMGGLPQYALVTLALPADSEVDDAISLLQGMLDLAEPHGVAIAGGDIVRASLVVITTAVTGSAPDREHLLTRASAMPGDRIAVTGYPGTAAAGLRMLREKIKVKPEASTLLSEAFLKPDPRVAEGQLLIKHGVRTAIDISDGLISDLGHICESSQVSARIEVDRLPIAPAVKANFSQEALELALSGGEDYELLFTAGADIIEKITREAVCPVTVIGDIITGETGKIDLVDNRGNPFVLTGGGWDHFSSR